MTTCLLVPADSDPQIRVVSGSMLEIQRLVEGNFTAIEGDGWTAYLDEEGQLKGLPINKKATALLRAHGWRGTYALGPVAFFGSPVDDEGEDEDVPDALVEAMARIT